MKDPFQACNLPEPERVMIINVYFPYRYDDTMAIEVYITDAVFVSQGVPGVLYKTRITTVPYNAQGIHLFKSDLSFDLNP